MLPDAQLPRFGFQRVPLLSPAADEVVHAFIARLVFQQRQRLEHRRMVLVFRHFRHGEDQEILPGQSQLPALFRPVYGADVEFRRIHPHAGDVFNALRVDFSLCQRVVLFVDGHENIRQRCKQPFRRVEHQPVFHGRTLEKVEAVGGVNHLGSPLPGVPRRQTGDHGAHRGMAVNDVEMLPVDNGFQLPVGFDVGRLPRKTFKGNVIVSIAEWNLAVGGVFIVVPRRHCCLPAHVLKHFQIGDMEFHYVGFDHRCHEQHFFHSIPSFRIQCRMYYTPFHVLFQPQARKKAGQPARPFHISFSDQYFPLSDS